MRQLTYTSTYKKDLSKLEKRFGKKLEQDIKVVVDKLLNDEPLDPRYKDHKLDIGMYNGYRDCHIKPDVLLIYYKPKNSNILQLVRIGKHNDLRLTSSLEEEYVQGKYKVYTSESAYDIANKIKNSNIAVRILYDFKLKRFFMCDADEAIHFDMIEQAQKQGYYPDLERWDLDEYADYYEDNVLHIVYTPKSLEKDRITIGDDAYESEYVYHFGYVAYRRDDLVDDCPLLKALGHYEAHFVQDGWKDNELTPNIIKVEQYLSEDDEVDLPEYEDTIITSEEPNYGQLWIRPDGLFQKIPNDENDTSLLNKLGYIRCYSDNVDTAVIELSKVEPTVQQGDAINLYLDMLRLDAMDSVEVGIGNQSQEYNLRKNNNDYILTKIKQFYTLGKLLA